MKNILFSKLKESLISVLPITVIVIILNFTPLVNLTIVEIVAFCVCAVLLILGMSLFNLGADVAMTPMGEKVGFGLVKRGSLSLLLIVCFCLGLFITIAEPDLTVLADQVKDIVNNTVFIVIVGVGVGFFLLLCVLKIVFKKDLSLLLMFFYFVLFAISAVIIQNGNGAFLPLAFDSGGVTTGPITVPFIMALGAGLAAMRKDKHSAEDSFGLVALCSIGPILSVLILSLVKKPSGVAEETVPLDGNLDTRDAFLKFLDPEHGIVKFMEEVAVAFLPIVAMFIIYQLIFRRFKKIQVIRISVGFAYTYVGLVLFLTGANVGFMPAGQLIGAVMAQSSFKLALIPIGMILGYFVVSAEPAVHTLKRQVEEVTNGAISQKSIGVALSVGVAVSVGISMLRVLTGIPILPILIVGYIVPLVITFFVPPIYTGIAFDSGGVASGPMATTFILPFAIGACNALGGDVMTDAFGIVAMIAMTPLITIQVLGLIGKTKQDKKMRQLKLEFEQIDDGIDYYDGEAA